MPSADANGDSPHEEENRTNTSADSMFEWSPYVMNLTLKRFSSAAQSAEPPTTPPPQIKHPHVPASGDAPKPCVFCGKSIPEAGIVLLSGDWICATHLLHFAGVTKSKAQSLSAGAPCTCMCHRQSRSGSPSHGVNEHITVSDLRPYPAAFPWTASQRLDYNHHCTSIPHLDLSICMSYMQY